MKILVLKWAEVSTKILKAIWFGIVDFHVRVDYLRLFLLIRSCNLFAMHYVEPFFLLLVLYGELNAIALFMKNRTEGNSIASKLYLKKVLTVCCVRVIELLD
jgi:hypothetical protein